VDAAIDTHQGAECAVRAWRGITPLVRVPYCELRAVTATLDAGAAGFMATDGWKPRSSDGRSSQVPNRARAHAGWRRP